MIAHSENRRAHLQDRALYRAFYEASEPERTADTPACILDEREPRVQWTLAHIGPTDDVLDVGCYDGCLTFPIRAHTSGRVAGIDLQGIALRRGIRHAVRTHVPIEFVQSWAEETSFPTASFDVVVLCEILEHVIDVDAVIRESERVVRPGGWIVTSTPVNAVGMERRSPDFDRQIGPDGQPFHLDGHVNEFLPQVSFAGKKDLEFKMASLPPFQWRMAAYRA